MYLCTTDLQNVNNRAVWRDMIHCLQQMAAPDSCFRQQMAAPEFFFFVT